MSIGVDFILRASSVGFTRAVAAANAGIKDLKKGLKDFDVGNGLKQWLGVGGVIAGFKAVISSAQEMRDELVKAGKPVDNMTRSVAELGDGFGKLVKSSKEFGVVALSYFTRAGEKAGEYINYLRGISKEQAAINAATEKAADKAEASLAKSREENSPEKLAAAQRETALIEREGMAKGTDAQKALIKLINERADLEEKLSKLAPKTVEAEKVRAEIARNELDSKAASAKFDEDSAKAAEKKAKADKETADARAKLVKEFAPNVEELAAQETGGFTSGDDPRLQARRILRDEEKARTLFNRGDVKGGLALAQKAKDARTSLETMGSAGEGGALTQQSAQQAFETALTKTNEELATLTEAVQGIIKAQK